MDSDPIALRRDAGHSFGGATAMLAAKSDPRVRAVANLDGRVPGEEPALAQPLLILLSAANPRPDGPPRKSGDVIARIAGASHTTFGDQALIAETFDPPPSGLDPAGLDAVRGIAITRAALAAFFDCTLRGDVGRCAELHAVVPTHGVAKPK